MATVRNSTGVVIVGSESTITGSIQNTVTQPLPSAPPQPQDGMDAQTRRLASIIQQMTEHRQCLETLYISRATQGVHCASGVHQEIARREMALKELDHHLRVG
ncbi:hypothetical protein [Herpetosiphon gulosus]|uniref:Uncharacterized protein n=1 Tax=Herpetosiphon gulosus TaxID=1973496 RepID=A0ABP9X9D1_9CHLR